MFLKSLEVFIPELLIVRHPVPYGPELRRDEAIAAFSAMPLLGHEAGIEQDAEVLRDGRAAAGSLYGQNHYLTANSRLSAPRILYAASAAKKKGAPVPSTASACRSEARCSTSPWLLRSIRPKQAGNDPTQQPAGLGMLWP